MVVRTLTLLMRRFSYGFWFISFWLGCFCFEIYGVKAVLVFSKCSQVTLFLEYQWTVLCSYVHFRIHINLYQQFWIRIEIWESQTLRGKNSTIASGLHIYSMLQRWSTLTVSSLPRSYGTRWINNAPISCCALGLRSVSYMHNDAIPEMGNKFRKWIGFCQPMVLYVGWRLGHSFKY